MKLTNAEIHAFQEIRRHLKAGATIKATDSKGRVLDPINDEHIFGGITITYPEGSDAAAVVIADEQH